MYTPSNMFKGDAYFESSYTSEQILISRSGCDISSLDNEDEVILEAFLSSKRVTIYVPSDPPSTYFYFYLSFIMDMRVFFPLPPTLCRFYEFLMWLPPSCSPIVRPTSKLSRWSVRIWSSHRPWESSSPPTPQTRPRVVG